MANTLVNIQHVGDFAARGQARKGIAILPGYRAQGSKAKNNNMVSQNIRRYFVPSRVLATTRGIDAYLPTRVGDLATGLTDCRMGLSARKVNNAALQHMR